MSIYQPFRNLPLLNHLWYTLRDDFPRRKQANGSLLFIVGRRGGGEGRRNHVLRAVIRPSTPCPREDWAGGATYISHHLFVSWYGGIVNHAQISKTLTFHDDFATHMRKYPVITLAFAAFNDTY